MVNEAVRDSFKRCETAGDFGETFYGIFLKKSPQIAELFAETDFSKQRKHLRASVFMLVNRDIEDQKTQEVLTGVGNSHSRRKLDIRPELYDIWRQSLCETVKELDSDWSQELESDWQRQVQPGIDFITSLY